MKKFAPLLFLLALFITIIVLSANFSLSKKIDTDNVRYDEGVISLANASIAVEMPLTRKGFEKGLGERDSLQKNSGMLFLCLPDAYPQFWMKGMRFPIDIIWIDESFTVVDITPEVSPESFPKTFMPSRPATHVLEVNSGFAKEHAIVPGTTVYGLGGSACGEAS